MDEVKFKLFDIGEGWTEVKCEDDYSYTAVHRVVDSFNIDHICFGSDNKIAADTLDLVEVLLRITAQDFKIESNGKKV